VECRGFEHSLRVDVGEPFNMIDLAEDALNADMVINLPKLKTHSQMLLTLGVKNMFGCVVGFRKPEWHLKTGVNHAMFAQLLVLIHQKIKPAFTVLDGVLAMEGNGPGSGGTPKELGVLIGSRDTFAVDETVCRMLGMIPDRLPTLKAAAEMGLVEDGLDIIGHLPKISNFKLPDIVSLMHGPRLLHGFMRKHLLQRPVCDDLKCRACGDCLKMCVAKAISLLEKTLRFDYRQCIRCYCCIEVCPHGALYAMEPLAGRALRKIMAEHF
jgi:ferredoxin